MKTDHLKLSTKITIEGSRNKAKGKYISRNLKPGLKQKEVDSIFSNEAWPRTPFIEIAESLKMTKNLKLQHNDTFLLK